VTTRRARIRYQRDTCHYPNTWCTELYQDEKLRATYFPSTWRGALNLAIPFLEPEPPGSLEDIVRDRLRDALHDVYLANLLDNRERDSDEAADMIIPSVCELIANELETARDTAIDDPAGWYEAVGNRSAAWYAAMADLNGRLQ
jgi:hypothetical protein